MRVILKMDVSFIIILTLRMGVYSLTIARERGGNRDSQPQLQKELINNQTKTHMEQ